MLQIEMNAQVNPCLLYTSQGERVLVQERLGDRPAYGLVSAAYPLSAAYESLHGFACGLFCF